MQEQGKPLFSKDLHTGFSKQFHRKRTKKEFNVSRLDKLTLRLTGGKVS